MSVPDWLDDAAAFATCATLTTTGSSLVGTGVATMWAGGGGVVPLGLGMLSLLAAGAACQPTAVDGDSPLPGVGGCQELLPGEYGHLQIKLRGEDWADVPPFGNNSKADTVNEITQINTVYLPDLRPAVWRTTVTFKTFGTQGEQYSSAQFDFSTFSEADTTQYRIRPKEGQSCKFGPDNPDKYPGDIHTPVQYTNPTTNCVYNITPQGFAQESEGGAAGMVFKIESAPETRADGGVVGGCNFEPTLVYQGPGGVPPYTIPWDPSWPDWDGGGKPPWFDLLKGALAGVVAGATEELLEQFLEQPLPETSLSINAACEYKEDGTPEEFTINFPEQKYQDRVLDALTAQVEFAQQFHLWKTPTCGDNSKPVLFLHWRSITFESDDYTETGNSRLVKRFRYRGSTPGDVVALANHWKDFEWDTGGVIVYHKGTGVGTPQVWAASEAEGKRVLRHAFAEAGVDPDQSGQWGVSGSNNPRYGVARRVKLKRVDGAWMATARQGPNGWPEAACIRPDP